ncbi:unnamed protein product [Diatraea saccharalis]|uniref:Uncharacterized protein n=1 Tax=Diatraea saccharalis TaxID=40085 RepID=A0A9N9RCH6_9NEOP|nr:unnamed protein product [Diatraea saccharalis]
MFFDDLFDSVNGSFSKPKGGKMYRTAVTPTSPHQKLWNKTLPVLRSMRFHNGINHGIVPSLSSWIKTVENFKRILIYLNSKGINSYIKLIIKINLDLNFLQCTEHQIQLKEFITEKCAVFFINNWCKNINHLINGKIHFGIEMMK